MPSCLRADASALVPCWLIQCRLGMALITLIGLLALYPGMYPSSQAMAQSPPPAESRSPGRQALDDELRQALNNARESRFDRITMADIEDHPLEGYVRYHLLRDALPGISAREVKALVDRYRASPLSLWMQNLAIRRYGEAGYWHELLQVVETVPEEADLQCHYLTALLKSSPRHARQLADHKARLIDLWQVAYSQPAACDQIFDHLIEEGSIHEGLIWARILLAWSANHQGLVNHLASLLPVSWEGAMQTLLATRSLDDLAKAPACLGPDCQASAAYYRQAFKQFTPNDSTAARSIWQDRKAELPLTNADQDAIIDTLAYQALVNRDRAAAAWVDQQQDRLSNRAVIELRIRRALEARQWQDVINWIQGLPKKRQASSRWRYWRGRALETLDQPEIAQHQFEKAAESRDFYGFLAAERLGLPKRLHLEQTKQAGLAEHPAGMATLERIQALEAIGEPALAKREWQYAFAKGSDAQRVTLATHAVDNGLYATLVQATLTPGMRHHLLWRFPPAHQEDFAYFAHREALDPYLLMAVARRESAFNPSAVSPAGARGMMQLMPTTAAELGQDLDLDGLTPQALDSVELNIQLGSRYMKDLLNRYQGNRVLASVAYNAGPSRLAEWLEAREGDPLDLFIERIPFRETRHYVQAVLAYRVIFEALDQGGSTQGIELFHGKERDALYGRKHCAVAKPDESC